MVPGAERWEQGAGSACCPEPARQRGFHLLKGREDLPLLLLEHHQPKRRQEMNFPLLTFGGKLSHSRYFSEHGGSIASEQMDAREGRSRSAGAVTSPLAAGRGTAAGTGRAELRDGPGQPRCTAINPSCQL